MPAPHTIDFSVASDRIDPVNSEARHFLGQVDREMIAEIRRLVPLEGDLAQSRRGPLKYLFFEGVADFIAQACNSVSHERRLSPKVELQ
jgi:hypothetical protein